MESPHKNAELVPALDFKGRADMSHRPSADQIRFGGRVAWSVCLSVDSASD